MRGGSNRTILLAILCVSVILLGCGPKKPISLTQTSFRLQPIKSNSLHFAPTVPESQAINSPISLILNAGSALPSVSTVCTLDNGPFHLEHGNANPAAIRILLPAPERWLSDLESGSQGEGGDIMETFYSFLAGLDRAQLLGCFALDSPPIRDYLLQSIPMKPSDSLFNRYGYRLERGGLDLKPGLRLKIERAYFRPAAEGEEAHSVKNYLGVSSSYFDVQVENEKIRFQQVGAMQYSAESLKKEGGQGSHDLDLRELPSQPHYRLLFYTYVVPKEQGISAAVIGATNANALDDLERELRAHPEDGCKRKPEATEEYCFEFNGFVTVSAQIQVELNGKSQFVDWGTKLSSVLPKNAYKSLRIQRLYLGSYYDVRFHSSNSGILSLALVGGDRLTWTKSLGAAVENGIGHRSDASR